MNIRSSKRMGLDSQILELDGLVVEYFTQAGPRIIRLAVNGSGANLLAEIPDDVIETPYGPYRMLGGHRLWHAPEAFPRTYVPDDREVVVDVFDDRVRLYAPPDGYAHIAKIIEIAPGPRSFNLIVRHTLTNHGSWPVELAPWAITQLPLGGIAILPDHLDEAAPQGLLPDRHLVLWPYTRLDDARLALAWPGILLSGAPALPPIKIGAFIDLGWAAYYREGTLFVKRFIPAPGTGYPDRGCNVECYCKTTFLELETLGPLTRLDPGESTTHVEEWEVFSGLDYPANPAGIRSLLADQKI